MTTIEQLASSSAMAAALAGLVGWWRERAAANEKIAFMKTEADLKTELAAAAANAARITRLETTCDRQDAEQAQLRGQLEVCQNARHEQEKKVAVLELLQAQRDSANQPPPLKIERQNA